MLNERRILHRRQILVEDHKEIKHSSIFNEKS